MKKLVPLRAAPPPGPPPLGALIKRPAGLLRGEGELLAVLDRYLIREDLCCNRQDPPLLDLRCVHVAKTPL